LPSKHVCLVTKYPVDACIAQCDSTGSVLRGNLLCNHFIPQMTDNSDLEIVDRVLAGEVDAFSVIISRYQDKIFRYVYSQVNSYDEAVDLTQEILVVVFESLRSFRREAKLYTWIFSIMVNFCKNYRKKRRRFNTVPLESATGGYEIQIPDTRHDPEKELVDSDSLRIVKEELFQLPDDYKEILILRDIEGLPYNDISSILGIHLSNVKVRIHRGREMLRRRLKERGLI